MPDLEEVVHPKPTLATVRELCSPHRPHPTLAKPRWHAASRVGPRSSLLLRAGKTSQFQAAGLCSL